MLQNEFSEPTDDELERLDEFLLDRVDEDAVTDGMDEGILDISELDGFLTAVVSGPTMIPPSQWLPAVWGDFEPQWESEEEFGEIVGVMIRYMTGIAASLMERPQEFEPLFYERKVKRKIYTVVDEWCEGYMRGVGLNEAAWNAGGDAMATLLEPIRAFTEKANWPGHEGPIANVEATQNAIAPNVREIHAYWLDRRDEFQPPPTTFRHAAPPPGRNDPCPCGSGKKFKKCCLN